MIEILTLGAFPPSGRVDGVFYYGKDGPYAVASGPYDYGSVMHYKKVGAVETIPPGIDLEEEVSNSESTRVQDSPPQISTASAVSMGPSRPGRPSRRILRAC